MSEKTTALVSRQMSDTLTVADHLARSGFFSDARQVSQAVAKVLAGQELGLGPVASMTGIFIIKGRVSLSANILAALVRRHPVYNYRVKTHTADECTLIFYESGEEIGISSFSMDDARAAQLRGDNWQKYPRNMLFARAVSNGVKWFCPDVMAGAPVYTPDELGAQVDGEGDVIPGQYTETVAEELPPLPQVTVTEDGVLWALRHKSSKGTPYWKAGETLDDCRALWQKIVDNRDRINGKALEAAVILLHEDAAQWVEHLRDSLEADEHAAQGESATGEYVGGIAPLD